VAWIALTPLLIAVINASPAPGRGRLRAFVLGLITGIVYFAGTVYWTGGVMAQYGGLSVPVAALIAGLLVAYLALFPAFFALTLHVATRTFGSRALLLAPALWTATEYGRLTIFGGFPWVLLGYSQVTVLPVAQLAAVTGVFGLSWLVAMVSAAAAHAVLARDARRWVPLAATLAGVALIAVVGQWRLSDNRLTTAGRPLRVGLIQGNVQQDDKWAPALAGDIFNRYLRLTRQAVAQGAQLVIWPESATPFYFGPDPETETLRTLARESGVSMLIGSDQWERPRTGPPKIYNAAFMIGRDGSTGGVYRKVHLVPFGEFVPMKDVLFFAGPLVQAVSDFSPGSDVATLPIPDGSISTAICYEVVYPSLIRDGVLAGSELLTTITNDAWFGRSSAPWQHFAMASMRAIEEGRYLVRAANTGVSGMVDPYGRVRLASELFVEGEWVVGARLLDDRTIYSRVGDLAAWISVALLVVAVLPLRAAGRRGRV
jgi:apolipoprotein N-acyltransferase